MSRAVLAPAERATRAVDSVTVMRRNLPPQPAVAALAVGITLPGVRTVVPGVLGQHVAEDPRAAPPPFGLGLLSAPLVAAAGRGLVAQRSTASDPTASSQDESKV